MDEVVLIVEDNAQVARGLQRVLDKNGCHTTVAGTGAEAREQMGRLYPDVVLMDLDLPDASGSDLIEEFRSPYPETTFIVLTGFGSIQSAAESMRRGASDYLTKPCSNEEVLRAIVNARRGRLISEELRRLRGSEHPARGSGGGAEMSCVAPSMQEVLSFAQLAAQREGTVLLLGETGTGKDYLARWLHRRSARSEGPFFALDAALQSKLLSFLDTRGFIRVGGERTVTIDTRIIAATNRDLAAEVDRGTFRRDLYYRINVLPICIPPLRERREDIPCLVGQMLGELSHEMGLSLPAQVTEAAMDALRAYDWPGNIRELRNVLERALIRGGPIDPAKLSLQAKPDEWRVSTTFPVDRGLREVVEEIERKIIREALRRAGAKSRAAEILRLTRHQLAYRIKVLGIDAPGGRNRAEGAPRDSGYALADRDDTAARDDTADGRQ